MDYREALSSPEWQKTRLRIMERDGFRCTSCGDSKSTLNVHHCVPYRKNKLPFEYEDCELITLCKDCHESISVNISQCKEIIMTFSYNLDELRLLNDILFVISSKREKMHEIYRYVDNLSCIDF